MIERETIIEILNKNNPDRSQVELAMYADAYIDYKTAADNIRENGAVCSHPKTGAPIENPFLKVRQQMQVALAKMKRIKTKGLD